MELTTEMYNWFENLLIVSDEDIKERVKNGIILTEEATQFFELGLKIIPLLHRLQAIKVVYHQNRRNRV